MAGRALEIGTLNDDQIIQLGKAGELISGNFDPKQVHQACYELRAGSVYYDLTEGQKRIPVPHEGNILVKPRHMVVIIAMEELKLPADILGRVLTKGAFFSLGLNPVNTYADPGFSGNLGIVLFNTSRNYIRVPVGTSIAKIEFSRLQHAVVNPYNGQHGYQTSIWPIRNDLVLTPEEVMADPRVGHPLDELASEHGELFSRVVKRVFRYERRVLIFAAVLLAVNCLVLWIVNGTQFQVTAATVFLGIVSNLATLVVTLLATNLKGN